MCPAFLLRLLDSLWSHGGQHMGNGVGDLVMEGWDVAWLPRLNPALPQFPPVHCTSPVPSPGLLHLGLQKSQ